MVSLPKVMLLGAALVLAAAPALAQSADGTYICTDVYNTPVGRLRIEGTDYSWTKINSAFEDLDASENGAGEISYDGPYFWPESGPLKRWGVTAGFGPDFVNINNDGGSFMQCRTNW